MRPYLISFLCLIGLLAVTATVNAQCPCYEAYQPGPVAIATPEVVVEGVEVVPIGKVVVRPATPICGEGLLLVQKHGEQYRFPLFSRWVHNGRHPAAHLLFHRRW
jgi:hypothetical protein